MAEDSAARMDALHSSMLAKDRIDSFDRQQFREPVGIIEQVK